MSLRKLPQAVRSRELTALEREFLPPLLEIQESPPSPAKRVLLWTLVALIAALTAWASVGKIAVVATAPGKLIPDGRVKELQPLESSIVKAIHVTEGQHVQAGELLLELDPTLTAAEFQASAEKYGLNQLQQARLNAELNHEAPRYESAGPSRVRIGLEEQLRRAREAAHASKLAEARADLEDKSRAVDVAQATLQKFRETTAIAEERESSARPLVPTGAISRDDYLQLQQDLATQRNGLVAQEHGVAQAEAVRVAVLHKLASVGRDRVADLYTDLDQRVASEAGLKGDLERSRQLHDLKWLRAPVSGYVQKVAVTTIGQVVTPAQSLVTIVPDGTPLVVEASLSNQDIAYVKTGQQVEIKVDTFPFQKYGTLRGTLASISPDAEERNSESMDMNTRSGKPGAEDSGATRGNAGYVYKVHVRPDQASFVVDGKPAPLQAGMTVQADIVTDHRRLIEFFLSPVVKYLDEGVTVR